jgi:hypothetical protein
MSDHQGFKEQFLFRLAADCLPIAERFLNHDEALFESGYRRHRVALHAGAPLCTPSEIETSIKIWHEMAKEVVASYGSRAMPLHGHSTGYKSAILEQLRISRAQEGLTFEWFRTSGGEAWRYYLAPVERILERERFAQSEGWAEYARLYSQARDLARQEEIHNISSGEIADRTKAYSHATEVTRFPKEYWKQLKRAARDILIKELELCDLHYDRQLSTEKWCLLSRLVSKNLQLRFGVRLENKSFESHLYLCHPDLPKQLYRGQFDLYPWTHHFAIRLEESAPMFRSAFCFISTPDEAEVAIRAITRLYKFEHNYISSMIEVAAGLL